MMQEGLLQPAYQRGKRHVWTMGWTGGERVHCQQSELQTAWVAAFMAEGRERGHPKAGTQWCGARGWAPWERRQWEGACPGGGAVCFRDADRRRRTR